MTEKIFKVAKTLKLQAETGLDHPYLVLGYQTKSLPLGIHIYLDEVISLRDALADAAAWLAAESAANMVLEENDD